MPWEPPCAVAQRPARSKADAGTRAPEVVHRGGTWCLHCIASDTTLPGGGSAIGVAASASPPGPWTDSGTPAVAP